MKKVANLPVKDRTELILPSELPKVKIDLPGLARYIKEHSTTYENLTEKEKAQFYH